ncbi:ubiquinol-cytochrome C reductase [alpha proteobacterium AAP81b]|nr:ubiquinol-cytochrome C reductase [alpha proteobacterium AAP81b]
MTSPPSLPDPGRAVPTGRLSRFARFGGLATGIAGGLLVDGARQLAAGKRPALSDLLLTPANARKITDQLSQLRGAAMKLGQLLSMGGDDLLPPALAEILGRLRADAQPMPVRQLDQLLISEWGKDWRRRFERFDVRPIAAASIGQVHRAQTRDGRDLAIKIQYPGIRASIDSDVDNVALLIRLSGLLPATIDVARMLAEAKRQLHEEADYAREADCLARFGELLADAPDYRVPALHRDLTTRNVLAMDFVKGVAVESLADGPQAVRDRVMTLALALVLRELFDFGLMQTDPNFANYRYDAADDRLVLLDFGATRAFAPEVGERYRALMRAGLAEDRAAAAETMLDIGFFGADTPAQHRDTIVGMFDTGMATLRTTGVFDFGDTSLVTDIRDDGLAMARDRDFWHLPPIDTLFLQRKFAGLYLLGRRLAARVDVAALLAPYR